MANLLTYDEIIRFALIALMVGVAFAIGAGTAWYVLRGAITDLQKRVDVVTDQLSKMIENG